MDNYSTHLPMLVNFVKKTNGTVIEFGMGDFSTPALHAICEGRMLESYDNHPDWTERFGYMRSENHVVKYVDNWDSLDLSGKHFSVAFVDHAPGERRIVEIERLKDIADFVVVHDSEAACYGYEPYFAMYKYRYDDKSNSTETTVVSNFFNPSDYL
jgi:hypothetical protein